MRYLLGIRGHRRLLPARDSIRLKNYLLNGLRPVRVDRGIKLLAVSPIGERGRIRTDG